MGVYQAPMVGKGQRVIHNCPSLESEEKNKMGGAVCNYFKFAFCKGPPSQC